MRSIDVVEMKDDRISAMTKHTGDNTVHPADTSAHLLIGGFGGCVLFALLCVVLIPLLSSAFCFIYYYCFWGEKFLLFRYCEEESMKKGMFDSVQ